MKLKGLLWFFIRFDLTNRLKRSWAVKNFVNKVTIETWIINNRFLDISPLPTAENVHFSPHLTSLKFICKCTEFRCALQNYVCELVMQASVNKSLKHRLNQT